MKRDCANGCSPKSKKKKKMKKELGITNCIYVCVVSFPASREGLDDNSKHHSFELIYLCLGYISKRDLHPQESKHIAARFLNSFY